MSKRVKEFIVTDIAVDINDNSAAGFAYVGTVDGLYGVLIDKKAFEELYRIALKDAEFYNDMKEAIN